MVNKGSYLFTCFLGKQPSLVVRKWQFAHALFCLSSAIKSLVLAQIIRLIRILAPGFCIVSDHIGSLSEQITFYGSRSLYYEF